jgi:hypothetical protein
VAGEEAERVLFLLLSFLVSIFSSFLSLFLWEWAVKIGERWKKGRGKGQLWETRGRGGKRGWGIRMEWGVSFVISFVITESGWTWGMRHEC